MKAYLVVPIILSIVILTFFLLAAPPKLPVYEVLRTDQPIQIDGNLDDLGWTLAKSTGRFRDNLTGEDVVLETEAKALYDDSFLYFAFHSLDSNIWSTFTKRDEHLWLEEVFEVFIQADPARPDYIELEVNPLGTMIDIYLIDIRKPIPYESWNSAKLKWAVDINGTVDGNSGDIGWSCEIALPLEDVVTAANIPPKPGDIWKTNLYRVDQRPKKAGLAWSPTLKRDFHLPEMFGHFKFSAKAAK